jgi:hypothetical protein
MSRKHYIEVATILRDAQQSPHEPAIEFIARELALMFKRDNRNFNAGKFFDAAELPHLTGCIEVVNDDE